MRLVGEVDEMRLEGDAHEIVMVPLRRTTVHPADLDMARIVVASNGSRCLVEFKTRGEPAPVVVVDGQQYTVHMGDLVKAITEAAQVDAIKRKVERGGWIAIEDKRPYRPEGGDVEVIMAGKEADGAPFLAVGTYDNGTFWMVDLEASYNWSERHGVTHWQPMPDKPEELETK